MSKAKAPKKARIIHIEAMGSPFSTMVFLDTDRVVPGMRIDNAGPFDKHEARKLARWILDTFGGAP